jgi:hypothetical protein
MHLRTSSLVGTGITAALLAVYVVALYFRAATASLNDQYQPGIELLQLMVWPGALLVGVIASASLGRSELAWSIAWRVCVGAILACLLLLLFVAAHEPKPRPWVFPADRTLQGTVHRSLFNPSFSNRSTGSIVGSAMFAAAMSGGLLLWRRRTAS